MLLFKVMPLLLRYTYRLRPGRLAERALIAEWHRARWVWNQAVGVLKRSGAWVSDKDLTRWRSEHAWLREGSVVAQQQELRSFRTKRAKGRGRKRFKTVKRSRLSLNYTQRGFALSGEGRYVVAEGCVDSGGVVARAALAPVERAGVPRSGWVLVRESGVSIYSAFASSALRQGRPGYDRSKLAGRPRAVGGVGDTLPGLGLTINAR